MKRNLWRQKIISKKTTHDFKTSCELSGITGKYTDFSKIKLFRQRDNTDVSKKMVTKKNSTSISLWALHSKYLVKVTSSEWPIRTNDFNLQIDKIMVLHTKITLLYAISYKRNKLNSRTIHSVIPQLFFTVDSLNADLHEGFWSRGMLQPHFARVSTHKGASSSSLNLRRELAPKYLTG